MKTLLLNSDFMPIKVITAFKAIKLVFDDKVYVIKNYEGKKIRTVKMQFDIPCVVVLKKYKNAHRNVIAPTRANIFKRDAYRCAYCNSQHELTIDHVLPKSKGGANTWENMVACCSPCNAWKSDRTPEQAGMKLKIVPKKPTFRSFLQKNYKEYPLWEDYVP